MKQLVKTLQSLHKDTLTGSQICSVPPSGLTSYYGHHHQAFESLLELYEARADYEEFCVPMCMLPATISNNVPGTDLSLGADTAINAIVEVRALTREKHYQGMITVGGILQCHLLNNGDC